MIITNPVAAIEKNFEKSKFFRLICDTAVRYHSWECVNAQKGAV
jgi:hypothetical protein